MCHDLHWLPVRQRIQYMLGTLAFKCLRTMAPSYLAYNVHSCRLQLMVVNNSTSPFCCPSSSDNYTQSTGAIWITQLRQFRPFDLELTATNCPRPDPTLTFTGHGEVRNRLQVTNHIHINNWQIKFENNRVVFNSLDSGRSIPYAVVHRGHITATNQLANKPSTVHTLIITDLRHPN